MRRRSRRGRSRRPSRRGSSAPRPIGSSGSSPTCSTSRGSAGRASRSPASPSISPASSSRRSSAISRARGTSAWSCPAQGRPDAWVLGDHDRILQAVSNLIENALRVTPSGGSVAVRAAPRRDHRPRHRPGPRPRGHPARVRALLPVRAVSQRAAGRLRARPRDRPGAACPRWAAASRPRRAAGGGAEFTIRLPSMPARSALPDAVRPSA